MTDQRGQASVEFVALTVLCCLSFGALFALKGGFDGRDAGGFLARHLVCAVTGRCDRDEARLAAAYGERDAAAVRALAPNLVYEPGERELPVDWRECRRVTCSVAPDDPGAGRTRPTAAGPRRRLHAHRSPRRPPLHPVLALLPRLEHHPRRLGPAVGAGAGGAAGYPGFHRDDWEGAFVRVDPDGSTWLRASSHGHFQSCKWAFCRGEWARHTGWVRVSRGSHSGHVPFERASRAGGARGAAGAPLRASSRPGHGSTPAEARPRPPRAQHHRGGASARSARVARPAPVPAAGPPCPPSVGQGRLPRPDRRGIVTSAEADRDYVERRGFVRARVCAGGFEGKRVAVKVGLVLGAGGVLGGAWLTGGLHALAERDRLGPRQRRLHRRHLGRLDDRRARAPAACRPGSWSPTRAGEVFDGLTGADGRPAAEADRAARRGLPAPPRPARRSARARCAWRSPRCRNPLRHTPLQMVAGWLPSGFISTDSLKDMVAPRRARRLGRAPELLGRRLRLRDAAAASPFGRLGSPRAEIGRRGRGLVRDPRLLPPGRRSAAAATSTAASARPRTSTWWPAAGSTS